MAAAGSLEDVVMELQTGQTGEGQATAVSTQSTQSRECTSQSTTPRVVGGLVDQVATVTSPLPGGHMTSNVTRRSSITASHAISAAADSAGFVAAQSAHAMVGTIRTVEGTMRTVPGRATRMASQVWKADLPGLPAGRNASESRRTIKKSKTLGDLLAFDDPELLRATFVRTVTGHCGGIFENTAGSEETYELSMPVDRIDTFISHNWAVARVYKFLILSVHFNLHLAAMAVFLVIATSISLSVTLETPAFSNYVGVPVFLVVLLFGRSFLCGLGLRGSSVFLDKCCIHQTDKSLQRRGIEKLGAYMANSNTVLICFTDMYLQRLWTVYEVATFLAVNSANNMYLIPICMPLLLLGGCLWTWALTLVWWQALLQRPAMDVEVYLYVGMGVATALGSIGVTVAWRYWARQVSRIESVAQAFDVRTAECFNEDDRAMIMSSIATLMRHMDRQYRHVDQGILMDKFNEFVRTAVPQALHISVGRVGVPYKFAVAATVGILTLQADRIATFEMSPFDAVLRLFVDLPLCIAFVTWSTKRCIRLRGILEAIYLIVIGSLTAGLFMAFQDDMEIKLIEAFIGRKGLPWYVLCVRTCILVAVTVGVFWPLRVADNDTFKINESAQSKDDLEAVMAASAQAAREDNI